MFETRVARANLRITQAPRKRPHSQVFNTYSELKIYTSIYHPPSGLFTSHLNDLSSEKDLMVDDVRNERQKYILMLDFSQWFCTFAFAWNN